MNSGDVTHTGGAGSTLDMDITGDLTAAFSTDVMAVDRLLDSDDGSLFPSQSGRRACTH